MAVPAQPSFCSVADYGSRLADASLWAPYVREVLRRHGPNDHQAAWVEPGFAGTFPTFLVSGLVVKLFGYFEGWRAIFETELGLHRLLLEHPHIPAPGLVAHGQLYDDGEAPWPYLVSTRLRGRAWRDLALAPSVGIRLAGRLGEIVRAIHELPVPPVPALSTDWMREHRDRCRARQQAWGTLPERLVEQIEDFLLEPSTERRLIHADLTEDHLFIDGQELVGIIDWGDAFVTDPYYELVALHLGAFGADTRLLRAFLAGYGWRVDDSFARRAMSAALLHMHDIFIGVAETARCCATLDDLAVALWDVG